MKQYSKWLFMTAVMIVALNLLPDMAQAQIVDPEGDPDAPLDGGVALLLATGIGYGIKKARENRKKKETAIF